MEKRLHLITLFWRHYGVHTAKKRFLVECEPLIGGTKSDPFILDEEKLLEIIGEDFLPVPSEKVLLMINGKGVIETNKFHIWAKYFDSYSLEVTDDENDIKYVLENSKDESIERIYL